MHQLALPIPYPADWCDKHRFKPELWPQHITDPKGKKWLVLHVGGSPYANSKPAKFCLHKPGTVEYHHIKSEHATPA